MNRHLRIIPDDPPPKRIKRSLSEVLDARPTITVAGAEAIGRVPVGNTRMPLLDLPWRPDDKDRRRGGRRRGKR